MDIAATLAARGYGAARPVTAADADATENPAARYAQNFAQVLERAETTARQAMTGDADPHALVTALSEAQMAVETAVAVRDRVVEAYMEILRMPV